MECGSVSVVTSVGAMGVFVVGSEGEIVVAAEVVPTGDSVVSD